MTAVLLFAALLLDAVFGEPKVLWSRLPHPAALMGRSVGFLERYLNKGDNRFAKGSFAMAVLVGGAILLGAGIESLPLGDYLSLLFAAILIAQHSMSRHLRDVANGLEISLISGRQAVALIVGRETGSMDETAVVRAAIESGAENFSDGVIAPALWFLFRLFKRGPADHSNAP